MAFASLAVITSPEGEVPLSVAEIKLACLFAKLAAPEAVASMLYALTYVQFPRIFGTEYTPQL